MSQFYALDCDLAFEKFQQAIFEEVDNCILPKKSKTIGTELDLHQTIEFKSKKHPHFLKDKINENKDKFIEIRNKLQNQIRETE